MGLTDIEWDVLVQAIKDKRCTVFLGAGVCDGVLPLGADIAEILISKFLADKSATTSSSPSPPYPFKNTRDLMRVAQFCDIKYGHTDHLKSAICELIEKKVIEHRTPDEPHRVLAGLALPLYITTNYDDLMWKALRCLPRIEPKRVICRWRDNLDKYPPQLLPSSDKPIIFHLHGCSERPESIVVTEDDYIDFLVKLIKDNPAGKEPIIPTYVQKALTTTQLLFIGYGLRDWNFRVVFRSLLNTVTAGRYTHITVQMPPDDIVDDGQDKAIEYLTKYYGSIASSRISIRVYWGPAKNFLKDLNEKIENVEKGRQND